MPPRTRRAAAAAAAPVEASFSSLPEPLQHEIFRLVGGAKERHRLLPMVCRRWDELCYSPELFRELTVRVGGYLTQHAKTVGSCLRSFFEWLLDSGAAEHVQRLELHMLASSYAVDHGTMFYEEAVRELWDVLQGGLAKLGQVGAPLRELVLREDIAAMGLPKSALARLGPGLRLLHFCVLAEDVWYENRLDVGARLQAFTALQDLSLTAYHLTLHPPVRLPPSLTALALGREVLSHRDLGVPLPLLLAPLTRLRRLGLRGMSLTGVDFDAFGSSLERLAMRDCGPLPGSTSRLTALQSLAWENTYQMQRSDAEAGVLSAAAADGALRFLTRLTFLSLMTLEGGTAQLPASLSSLGCLHTVSLLAAPTQGMALPPAGPYLTSLRCLLLDSSMAVASLPALSAMPHLEWLSLTPCHGAMQMEGYQSYPLDAHRREARLADEAWPAMQAWRASRPQPALRMEREGDYATYPSSLYSEVVQQTMARRVQPLDLY